MIFYVFVMFLTPETIVLGLETFNVTEFKPVVFFHDRLQLKVGVRSNAKFV